MAINFNYGSIHEGYAPTGGDDALELMDIALKSANLAFAEYEYKNAFMDMLSPYVEQYEGKNGTKVTEETHNMLFEDYGDQGAPMEYNPEYSDWTLSSKKYQGKNYSFTVDFWEKEKAAGKQPEKALLRRTEAVISNYENRFLPNIMLEAMYEVPATGGEYTDNFGGLRNVDIPEMMLVDSDDAATDGEVLSTVRNHFRVIADGAGVTADDFKFVAEYLDSYNDIDTANTMAIMNKSTRNKLTPLFEDSMSKDNFNDKLGSKRFSILGFEALEVKDMVSDMVMFISLEPGKPLLAELVNPNPAYRGLTLKSENSLNTHFEKPADLVENGGTKFVIENVGEHWIGRHKIMFLDLDKGNASTDRLMPQAGLDRIKNKAIRLKAQWKKLRK